MNISIEPLSNLLHAKIETYCLAKDLLGGYHSLSIRDIEPRGCSPTCQVAKVRCSHHGHRHPPMEVSLLGSGGGPGDMIQAVNRARGEQGAMCTIDIEPPGRDATLLVKPLR